MTPSTRHTYEFNSWKWLFVLIFSYALCLALVLGRQSLWLDELIDLHQIRDLDLPALLRSVPLNAGGVPLSYLARSASIHSLGYSSFSGRLPSLISSIVACAGIFSLAKITRMGNPLVAVLVFMLVPVQLRYAMESRPYSQALALSIWTTVVFIRLCRTPNLGWSALYTALITTSLYTQPYALFVPLSHCLWLLFNSRSRYVRRVLICAASAGVLSCALFLPWALWSIHLWQISPAAKQSYVIHLSAGAMIFKELLGAGYFGTSLLTLISVVGYRHHDSTLISEGLKLDRSFWFLYISLPLLLPIVADVYFNYFLATRQMIMVVAPLSLLAAQGLSYIWFQQTAKLATVSSVALVITFAVANYRFFQKPRENWEIAASLLERFAQKGTCIFFVPKDSEPLYLFFQPNLSAHICQEGSAPPKVVVAKSPYNSQEEYLGKMRKLINSGYSPTEKANLNGPVIELFTRRVDSPQTPPHGTSQTR